MSAARSSLPLVLVGLASLACAGLGSGPSEPEPADPAPADPEPPEGDAESPLVMNAEYWFDHDRAGKPEWDYDQRLTFRQSGECKLKDVEDAYTCTYIHEQVDGVWTVTITAYTRVKGPDGKRRDVDRTAGERFILSDDGKTLKRTDGMTFDLVEGG